MLNFRAVLLNFEWTISIYLIMPICFLNQNYCMMESYDETKLKPMKPTCPDWGCTTCALSRYRILGSWTFRHLRGDDDTAVAQMAVMATRRKHQNAHGEGHDGEAKTNGSTDGLLASFSKCIFWKQHSFCTWKLGLSLAPKGNESSDPNHWFSGAFAVCFREGVFWGHDFLGLDNRT